MEVNLVAKAGFPEEAILSIRSGSVKRQAHASGCKPFKFPYPHGEDKLLKLEVMSCIGTAYVVLKPFESRYKVALNEHPHMECEVEVKHTNGAPVAETFEEKEAANSKQNLSVKEAQDYLESTGLLSFVQAGLQAVIKERPKDPFTYMGRHFMNGYEAPAAPAPAPPLPTAAKPAADRTDQQKASAPGCEAEPAEEKAAPVSGADAVELRKKARATLTAASVGGTLELLLSRVVEEVVAHEGVASPAHGKAGDVAVEAPKDEGPVDLRTKARRTLHGVCHEGMLEHLLTKILTEEMTSPKTEEELTGIRKRAKATIQGTGIDGKFEKVLTKVLEAQAWWHGAVTA